MRQRDPCERSPRTGSKGVGDNRWPRHVPPLSSGTQLRSQRLPRKRPGRMPLARTCKSRGQGQTGGFRAPWCRQTHPMRSWCPHHHRHAHGSDVYDASGDTPLDAVVTQVSGQDKVAGVVCLKLPRSSMNGVQRGRSWHNHVTTGPSTRHLQGPHGVVRPPMQPMQGMTPVPGDVQTRQRSRW